MRPTVTLGAAGLALALIGCHAGDFPVAPTSGTVVCEGQPVPHAMVFFEPLGDGTSVLVGKQGTAIADEQGKFSISTYRDQDGAVIGKHRVRVGPPNADLHPGFSCPCEFNTEQDIMQVDVTEDGQNEFAIVLKKKVGQGKLTLEEREALRDAQEAAREAARAQRAAGKK